MSADDQRAAFLSGALAMLERISGLPPSDRSMSEWSREALDRYPDPPPRCPRCLGTGRDLRGQACECPAGARYADHTQRIGGAA